MVLRDKLVVWTLALVVADSARADLGPCHYCAGRAVCGRA